jgi:hypothetical protein
MMNALGDFKLGSIEKFEEEWFWSPCGTIRDLGFPISRFRDQVEGSNPFALLLLCPSRSHSNFNRRERIRLFYEIHSGYWGGLVPFHPLQERI